MKQLLAWAGWMAVAAGAVCLAIGEESSAPVAATNAPAAVAITNQTTGAEPSNTNLTVITSTQLRMDTDKKVAYFEGNVLVVDPQFQLRSNRMVVFLNSSGAGMDRAEAYEDVIIVQETEKRRARSQKAVYTPADGKMVLTGNPQLESDKGITRGQVITIFRTNNVVLVEGGATATIDLSTPASTNAPSGGASRTNAPPKSGSN